VDKGATKYCGRQTAFMWGTAQYVRDHRATWREEREASRLAKQAAKG